jgi:pimeloyl-ACP methyl ester carboxylesterase
MGRRGNFTPHADRAPLAVPFLLVWCRWRGVTLLRRDGPAVLLIHGFGSSLHTWEAWASLLENRFRVIALDLPGFGWTCRVFMPLRLLV